MNIILSILLTFILWFPPLAFGAGDIWFEVILQLAILAFCYVYAIRSIKTGAVAYRASTLNVFFLAFIIYPFLQLVFAATKFPYGTSLSIRSAAIFFALFFVVSNVIDTRKRLDDLLSNITSIGFVTAVIGIAQALTKTDKIYWLIKPPHGNFFGPFINENTFACYISIISIITLGSIFSSFYNWKRISPGMPLKRIIVDVIDNILNEKTLFKIFAFSVMSYSIFLSRSRSGMVFFTVSLALFLAFLLRKNKFVIITAVCGLAAAYILLNRFGIDSVSARIGSILNPEAYTGRAIAYEAGMRLLKEHPFFGIGLGAFANVFVRYNYGMELFAYKHLHNDIMQLLIEAGFAGFIIITIPLVSYIARFSSGLIRSKDSYNYCIGLSLLSSFLYLALHSFTDFQLRLNAVSSLAVVLLAMSALPAAQEQPKKIFRIKKYISRPRAYLFITLIFIAAGFFISKPFAAYMLSSSGGINNAKFAIKLEPGNPGNYSNYARLLMEEDGGQGLFNTSSLEGAEAALEKASALDPYGSKYKIEIAQVYYLRHDYKKAFDALRQATLLEPNNSRTHLSYAYMLFWKAINEGNAAEKDRLLKKGLAYYKMAGALSKHTFLKTVINDRMTYSILINSLKEEGIAVE